MTANGLIMTDADPTRAVDRADISTPNKCNFNQKLAEILDNQIKLKNVYALKRVLYLWFRSSPLYINKIQQDVTDAGIYLLPTYSTCFGCLSYPS